jgi:integrase
MQFTSRAEVQDAVEHFLLRPSRITGEPLSEFYKKRVRHCFDDTAKDLFVSGLRGGDLMRAVDKHLATRARTYASIGMVVISQVAYYYDLLTESEYIKWMREGASRYKPKRPVSEKILNKEQLKDYFDIFLDYSYDHFYNARLQCYASLLLLTGARSGAIVPVKMKDFTLTETDMTLKIKRLKSGNHQEQVIHIPLDVPLPHGKKFGEVLYQWLSIKPVADYLFCDLNGDHKSGIQMALYHRMFDQGQKIGMERVTPHMFRFTCASIVADHVGVRQAQQLLGHSDYKTTLRYANIFYDNTSKTSISTAFGTLASA